MIGIYEVYIDVYFIENVLLDAQVLTLVILLMKEKLMPWRLVASSLAGGSGAVLILLAGINYGLIYVLAVLAIDVVMLYMAVPAQKGHPPDSGRILTGIIYFHAMAFACGKLTACAVRLGMGNAARAVVAVLEAVVVLFMLACQKRKEQRRLYDVVLIQNGDNVLIKALFDTGNLLTDPVSGKPVSVLEETDRVKEWIEKSPQKYKVIPYRSIGNEHGILEGMCVDTLIIHKDNERMVKKDAIVALYKGRLSKDGSFQMILNQSLL